MNLGFFCNVTTILIYCYFFDNILLLTKSKSHLYSPLSALCALWFNSLRHSRIHRCSTEASSHSTLANTFLDPPKSSRASSGLIPFLSQFSIHQYRTADEWCTE
jgi:hypothetical protein